MYSDPHFLRSNYEVAASRVGLAILSAHLLALKAGFRQDQPRNDIGRWSGGAGSNVAARVTRTHETGNSRIDSRTRILTDVAKDVLTLTGRAFGPGFGTYFHSLFAKEVRALNLPGIGSRGVEESFSAGDLVRYGLNGSIRTDVIYRDGGGDDAPILAVWDIKTGTARLTAKRAADIRAELGVGAEVPIIEIHVDLGVDVKNTTNN